MFTILQKDVTHHSSVYNKASMPYTERLTWSGVALHAGGAARLSVLAWLHPSAARLRQAGVRGDALRHAGDRRRQPTRQPMDVLHPGLLLTADADKVIQAAEASRRAWCRRMLRRGQGRQPSPVRGPSPWW